MLDICKISKKKMSNKTEIKESNCYIDWLENSIVKEYFRYYEYSDFKDIQKIESGSFGNVVRAKWKNNDHYFALKSFNNNKVTLNEVVNEVQKLYNYFKKIINKIIINLQ